MNLRMFLIMVCLIIIIFPSNVLSETIDVQIKGIDDGLKTTKQKDYKESVLFAKREAIERAGVKIKSMTTVKDLMLNSDYIEFQAEAILLPGYNIIDVGYQKDGTYLVVLIGKVKTEGEKIESKELRYAKNLIDRGNKSKAESLIDKIIESSTNDKAVVEALYYKVAWHLTNNIRESNEIYEKMKSFYPDSKYVAKLEEFINNKNSFGPLVKKDFGLFLDKRTNLMWLSVGKAVFEVRGLPQYLKTYTHAGYNDWRLPTIGELTVFIDSICDLKKKNAAVPNLPKDQFGNEPTRFWTSNSIGNGNYYISFYKCEKPYRKKVGDGNRNSTVPVILVRKVK